MKPERYNNIYRKFGSLEPPYSTRTYFDSFSHECSKVDIEKKLVSLGYLHINGYNIKEDIKKLISRRPDIGENTIQHSAAMMISELTNNLSSYFWLSNKRLDELLNVLQFELRRHIVIPFDDDTDPYIVRTPSDSFDLKANGWVTASWKPYKIYHPENKVNFPGDKEYMDSYNETHSKQIRIFDNVPAEPWYGNPLKAKIIIIGTPPTFCNETYINKNVQILGSDPRISEEVEEYIRSTYRFDLRGIKLLYYDRGSKLYNSNTYQHWCKQISQLASETNIPEDILIYNTAVINPFPYIIENGTRLPDDLILPSHHFLRQMVRHIISENNPLFIIPKASTRNRTYWDYVMDDVWDTFWSTARIISGRLTNRDNKLTSEGFSRHNFHALTDEITRL